MKSWVQEFDDLCQKGEIEYIFFDDPEDTTKVTLKADNSDQQFPNIIKEKHYSVCIDLGGRYIYHFTPEKGSKRKVEVIANNHVDFMKKKDTDKNTGHWR